MIDQKTIKNKVNLPPEACVASKTVNLSNKMSKSSEEIAEINSKILLEIGLTVLEKKAFIGHIKSFINFETGGFGMSMVREKVEQKLLGILPLNPPKLFTLSVTAIVYGLENEFLNDLLNDKLTQGFPESLYQRITVNSAVCI